MEKNEGKFDRFLRVIIGIVALYLAWMYNPWWNVVAIIALITAFTGSCWLYKLLGISTAKKVAPIMNVKAVKKSKKKKY